MRAGTLLGAAHSDRGAAFKQGKRLTRRKTLCWVGVFTSRESSDKSNKEEGEAEEDGTASESF
jgi:hypothetical protein